MATHPWGVAAYLGGDGDLLTHLGGDGDLTAYIGGGAYLSLFMNVFS